MIEIAMESMSWYNVMEIIMKCMLRHNAIKSCNGECNVTNILDENDIMM